jgi:coenzyme F420-0:L-glutamate ligase/coenzyme F420-1:gamma-L-glutamate ligase
MSQRPRAAELRIIGIPVPGEIKPGDSIAKKLLQSLRQTNLVLQPGDILVLKHKIISKAEGQIVDLATIKPSGDSIAWAKRYKLDARVVELALRESRAIIRGMASSAPTAASMSRTSMADATLCSSPLVQTILPLSFIVNSKSKPRSPSRFSSPTHSAVPGAKAWSISVSASRE